MNKLTIGRIVRYLSSNYGTPKIIPAIVLEPSDDGQTGILKAFDKNGDFIVKNPPHVEPSEAAAEQPPGNVPVGSWHWPPRL